MIKTSIILIAIIGLLIAGSFVLLSPPDARGYSTEGLIGHWKMDDRLPAPVAHWKMNDSAANTTVVDETGTNNGTAQQNTDQITTTGKVNDALTFNGSSDYVNCGSHANLDITDTITISMWVKPNLVGGSNGYLLSKNNLTAGDHQYAIYTSAGRAQYYGSGQPSSANNAIPYNVWTNVVFTRTGGIGQFYINGVASGDPAACNMPTKPTFPVRLGCRWNAGTTAHLLFNGTIDDVRIYNTALALQQVQIIYNQGHGTEGDETTVVDTTADHNDGTLGDANGSPGATTTAHSQVSLQQRALTFDGVDDYVKIDNVVVSSPASLTISSWFKKESGGSNYECVLHQGTGNTIGASAYWMGVDLDDYLTATIGANTSVGWSAGKTTTIATYGQWYYLAAVWDGSIVRVYLNGEYNKQYNLGSYDSLITPTRIGASADGTNCQFKGVIDEVRIYERALGAEEIALHYFLGSETRIYNAVIRNAIIK